MNHYFTYINHKKQTNIYITVIQHPNKNTYITTTLKVAASHLHEHDRKRLRRSSFMSQDLSSPSILDAIEKKLDKECSPKRQKVDHKPFFQSKRSYNGGNPSAGSSHTPSSGKNTFRK